MRRSRKLVTALPILVAWAMVSSCGGGDSTGPARVPGSLSIQAGDNQSSTVLTAVATAPTVLVKDASGAALPGATVTFHPVTGSGTVTATTATTNSDGQAAPGSWTLGTVAGPQTLLVTVAGLVGDTVRFHATALAGPPASIDRVAGDSQAALVNGLVSEPLSVLVTDTYGNPVAGASVSFTVTGGAGAVGGPTGTTGTDGRAAPTSWRLGANPGVNTLDAAVAGGAGSPVRFTAFAQSGVVAGIVVLAGDGQSAVVATAVPTAPSVRVVDGSNSPIAGALVTFVITAGNGHLTADTRLTGPTGTATVGAWTLGILTGANTLSTSVTGAAIPPSIFSATGLPGAPATTQVSAGDGQSAAAGTAVGVPPAVVVNDQYGNHVPGATVQFQVRNGGGQITGVSPVADSLGVATVGSWTLGLAIGPQQLAVTSPGPQVLFNATATGKLWTGAASNDWATAANWSPAGVPTSTDFVDIPGTAHDPVLSANATAATLRIRGGNLTINGHTLAVVGDLTVTGGTFAMTNPADSVVVGKSLMLGGGDENGKLTAGVLRIADSLNVGVVFSNYNPLFATGTHLTILDGVAPQSVDCRCAAYGGSQFQNLEIRNSGGGVSGDAFRVAGRLAVATPSAVSANTIDVAGRVTTAAGSTLSGVNGHFNFDSLSIGGGFAFTTITATGGHTLPALTVAELYIQTGGPVITLSSSLSLNFLFVISGELILGGHTITASYVVGTDSSGVLTMNDPMDSIIAHGFAVRGGDETGHLTAGLLVVSESFQAASLRSFVASGTHRTRLDGAVTVFFAYPDSAGSHFQTLEMAPGASMSTSAALALGQLVTTGGAPVITGGHITVGGLDVNGLTLDSTSLSSVGGQIDRFDNVTFQRLPDAVTQFTLVHSGSAGSLTFNGLTFSAPATTGLYVDAVDADGLAPALDLTIFSNLSPAEGAAHTGTTGGPGPVQAQVTWQ
jgi:hypothetical protein